MNLDIKRAILSPFSDSKWHVKLTLPFIWLFTSGLHFPLYKISYINLVILNFTLFLPFWLILYGFYIYFAHNEIHNLKPLLPTWKGNWFKYLKTGATSSIIVLFLLILILILDCVLALPRFLLFPHTSPFSISFQYELMAITFIHALFFVFLHNFLGCVYADNFRLSDSFNLKQVSELILIVKKEILVCAISIIIFFLLNSFILSYFKNVFFSILSPLVVVLCNLMFINLVAQIYKSAKSIYSKRYGELA